MATTERNDAPVDGTTDYLARNARVVDVEAVRDGESEAWDRARDHGSDAEIETEGGIGRYEVEMPDGESEHDIILVKDGGDNYIGACDCDGFRYHGHCAHICTLAQRDTLNDPRMPKSNKLATSLLEKGPDQDELKVDSDQDGAEPLTVDDVQEEDVGEEAVDEQAKTAKPVKSEATDPNGPVEPRGSDGENPATDDDSDAFAGQLPDMGDKDHLIMEMGGEPYIRRAGYARLARAEGFRLDPTEVVGAHDTDWKHSKYRVSVWDKDGNVIATDVGTAHADAEDMANAEANLDELAMTRAACRALAWATGEGLNAVEEVAAEKARQV